MTHMGETARHRFFQLTLTMARVGVVGMAVSMPISRAVFNICALLMIVGWLLSGDWKDKLDAVRNSWSALASIALFAIGLLSLSWAEPRTADNWDQLLEYSRLLYIPLIISLLRVEVWRRRAWVALLTGMLATLALYLLDIWFEIPGTGSYGTHTAGHGVFYHHIAQGMMLSFLGAYGLHRALLGNEHWRLRLCWLAVALSTLAGLIAVGISRTGQLSVLAACFLVVLTHLPQRLRLWGLLLCLLFASVLVVSSDRMQERFALAFKETSTFEQDGERTSVGARLKAWQFSAELIQRAPWLGHGIGSYRPLAYEHFAKSPICDLGVCEQPHNQFLLTAVETGALGVLALVAFLVAPLVNRAQTGSPAAYLTLPFLAVFVVTACFDSSLNIQAQSFFTVTTLALLMASRRTLSDNAAEGCDSRSRREPAQNEGSDSHHST